MLRKCPSWLGFELTLHHEELLLQDLPELCGHGLKQESSCWRWSRSCSKLLKSSHRVVGRIDEDDP